MFVIARNSTFTYKGQAADVKRVARELGGRYVLWRPRDSVSRQLPLA
jgi:TolB-like protein